MIVCTIVVLTTKKKHLIEYFRKNKGEDIILRKRRASICKLEKEEEF